MLATPLLSEMAEVAPVNLADAPVVGDVKATVTLGMMLPNESMILICKAVGKGPLMTLD